MLFTYGWFCDLKKEPVQQNHELNHFFCADLYCCCVIPFIFQTVLLLDCVAADCAFEVILSIIYSSKREHLSGVVIWTLQASCLKPQTFRAHFRSLDKKKKKKKVKEKVKQSPGQQKRGGQCVWTGRGAVWGEEENRAWGREACRVGAGAERSSCSSSGLCKISSTELLLLLSATCLRHGEDRGTSLLHNLLLDNLLLFRAAFGGFNPPLGACGPYHSKLKVVQFFEKSIGCLKMVDYS